MQYFFFYLNYSFKNNFSFQSFSKKNSFLKILNIFFNIFESKIKKSLYVERFQLFILFIKKHCWRFQISI